MDNVETPIGHVTTHGGTSTWIDVGYQSRCEAAKVAGESVPVTLRFNPASGVGLGEIQGIDDAGRIVIRQWYTR